MSSLDHADNSTTELRNLAIGNGKMPAAKTPAAEATPALFQLRERDVEVLSQSEGFAILREHLAGHYADEFVNQLRYSNTTY